MRPARHFISPIDYIHDGEDKLTSWETLAHPQGRFSLEQEGEVQAGGEVNAVPKSLLPPERAEYGSFPGNQFCCVPSGFWCSLKRKHFLESPRGLDCWALLSSWLEVGHE